jgi:hypothetical protein
MSQDNEVDGMVAEFDEVVRILYAVLHSVGAPVTINPVDIEEDKMIMVDPQLDGTLVISLVENDGIE